MLGRTNAVANLAVSDLERARRFYVETLGLEVTHNEVDQLLVLKSGASSVNVYVSEFAGTNKATAATWEVDDVEAEVAGLKAKGVAFEHYDMPGLTLEGDLHAADGYKIAWFKDPDGNILNVVGKA